MKKLTLVALAIASTLVACGHADDADDASTPSTDPGAERAAPPAPPAPEPPSNPLATATEGTTEELVTALQRGGPDPIFVVVKSGTRIADGDVVAVDEHPAAHALRLGGPGKVVVELLRAGATKEVELELASVLYLKTIDHAGLGIEIDRATTVGFGEIVDFDVDENARRVAGPMGIVPGGVPAAGGDFDCIARFAQISASRDFIPFPLTNCSAPQDPVGDPERIADAVQAKQVATNIYAQMVTDYANAQAMIAALNARLQAIRNAYIFILTDPYYKEYNLSHFKEVLHGHKSYNDRFDRAEKLLIAAALAAQAQLNYYLSVPPPSLGDAKSTANRIIARKWNCVLHAGLLNNGGRSSTTVVGVSLETVGAPFVNIQVMLDDHPPLPQDQGWGGIFGLPATPTLPTDVTRLPVSSFVPVRASVGLPIVMFRFQPLDAKKTRPVGKACNLRVGIVQ